MTNENKRFTIDDERIKDNRSPNCYIEYYKGLVPIVDLLNKLHEEKEQLEKENAILKITIARNESYISRVTHKGEWKNTTKP